MERFPLYKAAPDAPFLNAVQDSDPYACYKVAVRRRGGYSPAFVVVTPTIFKWLSSLRLEPASEAGCDGVSSEAVPFETICVDHIDDELRDLIRENPGGFLLTAKEGGKRLAKPAYSAESFDGLWAIAQLLEDPDQREKLKTSLEQLDSDHARTEISMYRQENGVLAEH